MGVWGLFSWAMKGAPQLHCLPGRGGLPGSLSDASPVRHDQGGLLKGSCMEHWNNEKSCTANVSQGDDNSRSNLEYYRLILVNVC